MDTTQGGHGIYRVGDAAVIINGSMIASFNDDGQVFSAISYADTSGLGAFGSELRAPVEVNQGTQSGFGTSPSVQVETLPDGNVVVVWVDAGTQPVDSASTSVWFRIYAPDGSEITGPTLVNTITAGRQDTPLLFATQDGFVVGYSVLDFKGTQEGRLKEYSTTGTLLDTETAAYVMGTGAAVRTDNNTAFVLDGQVCRSRFRGTTPRLRLWLPRPPFRPRWMTRSPERQRLTPLTVWPATT